MNSVLSLLFILVIANVASADPALDLIHTAKAVKAIMEKGNSIPAIIAIDKVQQMSSPPKDCIMVIYERRPNTDCPNEFGQGPFMDKAFVACFHTISDEVDYVGGAESQCPPNHSLKPLSL